MNLPVYTLSLRKAYLPPSKPPRYIAPGLPRIPTKTIPPSHHPTITVSSSELFQIPHCGEEGGSFF